MEVTASAAADMRAGNHRGAAFPLKRQSHDADALFALLERGVTPDSDFRIYRRFGNKVMPIRIPD
jgi:hypothetical protein